MEINDSFRVDLPVEETWRVLMDIERIAPCLPGAQLQEIDGEEYRGVVKVKVGPITAQYKGAAQFESRDDVAHTAVIKGSGRDTRGPGQRVGDDHDARSTPDGTGHRGVGVHRPRHHRQGRAVRPRGHGRRVGEAARAVRRQPRARRALRARRSTSSPPRPRTQAAAAASVGAGRIGPASGTGAPAAPTDPALSGPPTSNGALKTEDGVTVRTIDSPEVGAGATSSRWAARRCCGACSRWSGSSWSLVLWRRAAGPPVRVLSAAGTLESELVFDPRGPVLGIDPG